MNANVVEIFYHVDEFCKQFDNAEEGHLLKSSSKKKTRNRKFTMSDSEVMTILILFHLSHYRELKAFYINHIKRERTADFPKTVSYNRFVELQQKVIVNMKNSLMHLSDKIYLRKRVLIETVNDEFKNVCQIEHTRHRSFNNFINNMIAALIAYNFLPKKPALNLEIIDLMKSTMIA
ncbi:MAG: transposase [Odoribacteraceae bacterium]|jgi:hypothetical protein|nr:transposase [Odoribacteraceae bacterium]